jgi:hypothetical protein
MRRLTIVVFHAHVGHTIATLSHALAVKLKSWIIVFFLSYQNFTCSKTTSPFENLLFFHFLLSSANSLSLKNEKILSAAATATCNLCDNQEILISGS